MLIVFDDMIAAMESNKNLSSIVTELFLLQHIPSNHSSDTDFKDFIKLYKDYTKEPYSFLVKYTISSPDNPLRFRKNLL